MQGSHHSHDHTHHIGMFRQRFYASLLLTVPILFLSPMIRGWIGLSPDIAFQKPLLLLFATAIYIYGGWPFLTGLVAEVRMKLPGMMTLIAMAMSVAFFYSALTLILGFGKSFFWELVWHRGGRRSAGTDGNGPGHRMPHALGLAIPLVVALSTSLCARHGILIRDRRAFEEARRNGPLPA